MSKKSIPMEIWMKKRWRALEPKCRRDFTKARLLAGFLAIVLHSIDFLYKETISMDNTL